MSLRKSCFVMALAVCGGASGTAGAVVVTFDAANGYNTNVEGTDFERASGTWVEAGFNVAWDYVDGGPDAAISALDGGPQIASCAGGGCEGKFTNLVFTRPDRAAFTLEALAVGAVTSSYYGDVTRYDPNDPGYVWEEFFAIVPDLTLEGTRRDGTTVTIVTPSMLDGTSFTQARTQFPMRATASSMRRVLMIWSRCAPSSTGGTKRTSRFPGRSLRTRRRFWRRFPTTARSRE